MLLGQVAPSSRWTRRVSPSPRGWWAWSAASCCGRPRRSGGAGRRSCATVSGADGRTDPRDPRARPRTSPGGTAAESGWHTGGDMTALPLVFDAPKRALPPRHLADLDPAERRAAVAELGLPAFRADQLARHYFGRLTADLAEMTDLPAAAREVARRAAARRWSPRCGAGLRRRRHPQDAVARRTTARCAESRADALPGPGHRVRLQPGRAAGWPARSAPPARVVCSATCPPPRSSSRCGWPPPPPGTARWATRAGCPTSCSWAWASRWRTTSGWSPRSGASSRPAPDGLGISARGVTVSTVGLVPAIDKLTAEGLQVTLAVSLHAPDDELRDTLVPVNNAVEGRRGARRRAPLRRPPPGGGCRSSTR